MNGYEEKIHNGLNDDLILYYCGRRIKNISHRYGPHTRNTYLLYYICEGSATLTLGGRSMNISAPGFFVNYPQSQSIYQSKKDLPWTIKWIVIGGARIDNYLSLAGISRENPYKKLDAAYEIDRIFDQMYERFDMQSLSSKFECISLLYRLFSCLADGEIPAVSQNRYVREAFSLINRHFSDRAFTVDALSNMLNLHYNYFSILFKKETGITPMAAINDARMQNATKMLRFTDRTVKEIAIACGFSDEFYFSRKFKRQFGISPKEYRKAEAFGS